MAHCLNYGHLVQAAFEAAERVPEWARGWMRKRAAEHLLRAEELFWPLPDGGDAPAWRTGRGEDSWAFVDALPPREREAALAVRAASERFTARARERGEAPVAFVPDAEFRGQVDLVRDWLHALPETDADAAARADGLIARRKLARVTFAQALAASERWHALLARRGERDDAREGDPGAVEAVLELDGGMRWVRLLTPEARDYEGAAMGHCVGRGGYDGKTILSLRDARNRPHCTVEVARVSARSPVSGGLEGFAQVKGRANGAVAERYVDHVIALAAALRPCFVEDADKFGCVWLASSGARGQESGLVRANDIPAGTRVNGHLDLSDRPNLNRLPDDMRVCEDLWLDCCAALARLPDRLGVEGSLSARGCTGLTALGAGLRVGGRLLLRGCSALAEVPGDLRVGGDIDLEGCTALRALPPGLDIARDLDLTDCGGLRDLPEGMRVGGSLWVTGCTGLESLPPGMRVGGTLWAQGCTALRRLGENLKVGGHLDLRDCAALERLPEGLFVGKILDLTGCTALRGVPDRFAVGDEVVAPDGESSQDIRAWFRERFPESGTPKP